MATYEELSGLSNNSALRNRVGVALNKKAEAEIAGAGTLVDRTFALAIIKSPKTWRDDVLLLLLAANSGLSTADILDDAVVTDAAIQSKVDTLFPQLALTLSEA